MPAAATFRSGGRREAVLRESAWAPGNLLRRGGGMLPSLPAHNPRTTATPLFHCAVAITLEILVHTPVHDGLKKSVRAISHLVLVSAVELQSALAGVQDDSFGAGLCGSRFQRLQDHAADTLVLKSVFDIHDARTLGRFGREEVDAGRHLRCSCPARAHRWTAVLSSSAWPVCFTLVQGWRRIRQRRS